MKYSRAGLIVLWSAFMHMTFIGSDIILYHIPIAHAAVLILVVQALSYLLYPLLGWLADVRFTRYKFVKCSFIFMIIGTITLVISTSMGLAGLEKWLVPYIGGGLSYMICLAAMGMFESTAIQFGMDQMLEASSDQLSTFIHWYYWSSKLGRLMLGIILTGSLVFFSQCHMSANSQNELEKNYGAFISMILVLIMGIMQILCTLVGFCALICSKRILTIDQTGHDPWKLVYVVLRYAWNHTCPERRSAFTYWEEDIPPRIDLGKDKYGGPFTTEEVEDTKTFLRILLLFLPLLGFQLTSNGYSVAKQLMRIQCPPYWMVMIGDPMVFSILTIIIGIPIYQWIILPRYRKYLPNMLKRMGLGLILCLAKEIIEVIIKVTMTGSQCIEAEKHPAKFCYYMNSDLDINGTCTSMKNISDCESSGSNHIIWLILPSVLHGLALLLVFMTTLEFICAQAPLRMKGLLIGLWYASLAANYLLVEVPELYIADSDRWTIFQGVRSVLILVFLMLYLCASKRYQYRHRDEVVNEQFLVEEVYERELDMAEEYEREKQAEWRALGLPERKPLLESCKSATNSYGTQSFD